MRTSLYILACLIIPAVWGLAASRVYDWVTRRRAERPSSEETHEEMYHI